MLARYLENTTSAPKPSILRTRLSYSFNVYRVPVEHKPDYGIWPDLSEASGLVGGESQHGVVLGVVEDVVRPKAAGGRGEDSEKGVVGRWAAGALEASISAGMTQ
jgi:hypothetical protein